MRPNWNTPAFFRRPAPYWVEPLGASVFIGGHGDFAFLDARGGDTLAVLPHGDAYAFSGQWPWQGETVLTNRRSRSHGLLVVDLLSRKGQYLNIQAEPVAAAGVVVHVVAVSPGRLGAWVSRVTYTSQWEPTGQSMLYIDETGQVLSCISRATDLVRVVVLLSPEHLLVGESRNARVQVIDTRGCIMDSLPLPGPPARLHVVAGRCRFFASCRDAGLVTGTLEPLGNVRPIPDPDLRWGFAAVRGDQLYVMATGWVAALNEDLTCRFKTPCQLRDEDNQIQSPPCFLGDRMYVGSNNGSLWCYDCRTGELLDRLEFPRLIPESPATDGERIFVGCGDGKVYCVQP